MTNDNKAKKQDAQTEKQANVRYTDANPEVKDASVLEPTQEQQKDELAKHSEFEQKTGVKLEDLDTRPVVDTKGEQSYAERTRDTQPWRDYQDEHTNAKPKE